MTDTITIGSGIGAAMAGGNPRRGRQDGDHYPTPRDVTRALMTVWKPQAELVWEPACGEGLMVNELQRAGLAVIASDITDHGFGEPGVDFLSTTTRRADCIITNPPFNLAHRFIEHAFDLGATELALVLKSTYWHAAKRQGLWEKHRPSLILPLLWRPDFLGLGGPTMEVIWSIWSPGSGPTEYRPLARPR